MAVYTIEEIIESYDYEYYYSLFWAGDDLEKAKEVAKKYDRPTQICLWKDGKSVKIYRHRVDTKKHNEYGENKEEVEEL